MNEARRCIKSEAACFCPNLPAQAERGGAKGAQRSAASAGPPAFGGWASNYRFSSAPRPAAPPQAQSSTAAAATQQAEPQEQRRQTEQAEAAAERCDGAAATAATSDASGDARAPAESAGATETSASGDHCQPNGGAVVVSGVHRFSHVMPTVPHVRPSYTSRRAAPAARSAPCSCSLAAPHEAFVPVSPPRPAERDGAGAGTPAEEQEAAPDPAAAAPVAPPSDLQLAASPGPAPARDPPPASASGDAAAAAEAEGRPALGAQQLQMREAEAKAEAEVERFEGVVRGIQAEIREKERELREAEKALGGWRAELRARQEARLRRAEGVAFATALRFVCSPALRLRPRLAPCVNAAPA